MLTMPFNGCKKPRAEGHEPEIELMEIEYEPILEAFVAETGVSVNA